MLSEEKEKYGQWLAAIANTRLLFNTTDELESFMGNRAIHSNGMRRCYATPQRQRAAYRDLKAEAALMTDGLIDLDRLMDSYRRAWSFYKAKLSRRKNPRAIAHSLLALHYAAGRRTKASKSMLSLYGEAKESDVEMSLLALLLLRAIPGYDGKSGDATDIEERFARTLDFLQSFTGGSKFFDVLPVITKAREEKTKNTLMLIHHFILVLDTYEAYSTPGKMEEMSNRLKEKRVELDLAGFWESDSPNCFWQIEESVDEGIFFATQFLRESARLLSLVRYTLTLIESEDERLIAYFLHPLAMKHQLNGRPYTDQDHAWYIARLPDTAAPPALALTRTISSSHWPATIVWNRVPADSEAFERYDAMVHTLACINRFKECDYRFSHSIYAITLDALFVLDEQEECFYRLPRYTEHKFEMLSLDSAVGIFEMGGRRYLAIDERMLFIPLTPRHLGEYGIERTYEIG